VAVPIKIFRVPLAEQELPTLPKHLSSPLVFSGVRVTRSLVLYVCFVDHCLSFCTFSFGRRVNLVTNPVISHERGKDRKKCLRQVKHIRGILRYTDSDYSFGILRIFLSKSYPIVL
jgi:hypothetical protein